MSSPARIARPPRLGMSFSCSERSLTCATAPTRNANFAASGVSANETIVATANAESACSSGDTGAALDSGAAVGQRALNRCWRAQVFVQRELLGEDRCSTAQLGADRVIPLFGGERSGDDVADL